MTRRIQKSGGGLRLGRVPVQGTGQRRGDVAGLKRLLTLQAQLAAFWSEMGIDLALQAGERLVNSRKLRVPAAGQRRPVELWIECAERAYARMVTRERYCRVQAEWVNTLFASRGLGSWLQLTNGVSLMLRTLRQAQYEEAGCTQRQCVWRIGKTSLYRYHPLPFARPAHPRPLLICYALVNRPYVLDLSPGRSWVRRLLAAGFDVYLIDWGDPEEADRDLGLEDYIERHLGGCVGFLLASNGAASLDLLGVCQGGTFSLCYAALHRCQVRNLVTVTTPVDFRTPDDLLSKWVRHVDPVLLERAGNLSGEVLSAVFLSLMPFKLSIGKFLELLQRGRDPELIRDFMRLEQWIHDGPAQAAAALAQFVRWFYQENRLVHGTLRISGSRVDLRAVTQPVLNIFGTRDHIVPAEASATMRRYIGSRDYSEHAVDTGHIGMYVSRRAARSTPDRLIAWLRERR